MFARQETDNKLLKTIIIKLMISGLLLHAVIEVWILYSSYFLTVFGQVGHF